MAAPAQPTGSLVKFSRAAGLLRGAPAPQRRRAAAQRCDKDNTSTSFWGGDMSARSVDGWTRWLQPKGRRRRRPRSSARPADGERREEQRSSGPQCVRLLPHAAVCALAFCRRRDRHAATNAVDLSPPGQAPLTHPPPTQRYCSPRGIQIWARKCMGSDSEGGDDSGSESGGALAAARAARVRAATACRPRCRRRTMRLGRHRRRRS